jgi:6,7-dimethyl-8-ribityllumazine synthase
MRRDQKISHKKINGSKFRIGIIVSEFNRDITEKLLSGALKFLKNSEVKSENVEIIFVPGSFEIPLACEKMAARKKYNALIALGCVIKGETEHHRYISAAVSSGIMNVMLNHKIPVGFGILTPDNLNQAKARSSEKNNKGEEAARAALIMTAMRFK